MFRNGGQIFRADLAASWRERLVGRVRRPLRNRRAGRPVAGGALTSGLSWRAIFFLNLPTGLVAAVLS